LLVSVSFVLELFTAALEQMMKISTTFSNTSVHPLMCASCQVAKCLWDNAGSSVLNIVSYFFQAAWIIAAYIIVEKSSHKNLNAIRSGDRGG
jgi:predicted permease